MKWLQFILSHSIFISLCAVGLCYQTFYLLQLPVNYLIYGLIFCSTLSSYNFYWLISKYYFTSHAKRLSFFSTHFSNLFLFCVASVGLLYCLFQLPKVIPAVCVGIALTLLYSVPLWPIKALAFTRRAGFLKTVLLAFTWAYVTVIIPAQQSLFIDNLPTGLLFTARFLFMLMLCAIFDSRDIKVDKIHALRSLATDVSARSLQVIMILVFCLYMLTGFLLRYYFDNNAQVIAFAITGLLTWLVYRLSLKDQNYYFYYFGVDGLMLFSAAATYVASI